MRFARFVFRRIINGFIAYLLIIMTFTLVLNTFLDISVRGQLNYMVTTSMGGFLSSGGGVGKTQYKPNLICNTCIFAPLLRAMH